MTDPHSSDSAAEPSRSRGRRRSRRGGRGRGRSGTGAASGAAGATTGGGGGARATKGAKGAKGASDARSESVGSVVGAGAPPTGVPASNELAAHEGRPRTARRDKAPPAPGARTPVRRLTVHAALSAHEEADRQTAARVAANRRRTHLLCFVAALLPAVVLGVIVGVGAGVVPGAVVGAVVLTCVWLLVLHDAVRHALHMIGGRRVRPDELPSLANQVDGLCATIGVSRPDLRVLDHPSPNACALGTPNRGVLVVTSGLVERLGLIEMEGVVAHELVHLKRRDAVVSAVAIATVGLVCWLSRRDGLLHAAVGRGREYDADQAAALAVRYPPGLHDALCALQDAQPPTSGPAATRRQTPDVFGGRKWSATRWIWIDPMLGARDETGVGELDATDVRVAALAEW
jgi:Zn-dependent protease with chaperone function